MTRNDNKPVVSVLLPVYNAERYLREAVESVLGQTFTDFELIAVDDGSTDGSLAILREFERRDGRVRVISRPNTGIVGALNDGLAACRGEFVARMDGDDVCLPERFERQVQFLRDHSDVLAVSCAARIIDADGIWYMNKTLPQDHDAIDRAALEGDGGAMLHPALMVRTEVLRAVGGYDPRAYLVEDWELYLRLAERGRLANLQEPLLSYRTHATSICATRAKEQWELRQRIAEDVYRRRGLEKPGPLPIPEYRSYSERDMHSLITWCALSIGNVRGARKAAWRWVRRQPTRREAWRALFCAIRGW